MTDRPAAICFGEVLWDCLPRGLFLGGAPFNVAYHLARFDFAARMVSAVGDDFLGGETRARVRRAGVDDAFLRADPELPTGAVQVRLDASGDAEYTILEPVAWDRIEIPDGALPELRQADALVFGALAMRETPNRTTLARLLDGFDGLKVCDVNLRPTFDDLDYARELLGAADLVKLNDAEIERLTGRAASFDRPEAALEALAESTGASRICLTFGGEGAALRAGGSVARAASPEIAVRDTVGAGDAFTAALVDSMARGAGDPQAQVERACRLGAFVASQDGAQPAYDPRDVLGES